VAYAEVEPLGVWSRVWAYGSMVDNATGDPTTIPAVPYCKAVEICR
jgi:hypothetical protein